MSVKIATAEFEQSSTGTPDASGEIISREQLIELRRMQLLRAMASVVAEHGFHGASVARVIERAGVSRMSFYEQFDGVESCFLATLEWIMGQSTAAILRAYESESNWLDAVPAALAALLLHLDAEPQLAWVCVVETLAAGPRALQQRQRELAVLGALIDAGAERSPPRHLPPALAIEGVIGSVLGVLHAQLISRQVPPFIALLGPLTGLVLLPYLDARSIAVQIERAQERVPEMVRAQRAAPPGLQSTQIPRALQVPTAYRARQCLLYLAANAGASNRQIAQAIGIAHQGQMSRLLGRLCELELAVKQPLGPGRANAWSLSARGQLVSQSLREFTKGTE